MRRRKRINAHHSELSFSRLFNSRKKKKKKKKKKKTSLFPLSTFLSLCALLVAARSKRHPLA